MLNKQDYLDIEQSLGLIRHIQDNSAFERTQVITRRTLAEFLTIAAFILVNAKEIFYTRSGRPKNVLEIMLSIGPIISFVRELVRMITTGLKQKPIKLSTYKILTNGNDKGH